MNFPGLSIFTSGYNLYSINESHWILIASVGSDFYDKFYTISNLSTNSRLS
jgi:hypothetical protein